MTAKLIPPFVPDVLERGFEADVESRERRTISSSGTRFPAHEAGTNFLMVFMRWKAHATWHAPRSSRLNLRLTNADTELNPQSAIRNPQ